MAVQHPVEEQEVRTEMLKDYPVKLQEPEQIITGDTQRRRDEKIGKIHNLQQRIHVYRQIACQQIEAKCRELLDPLYSKAVEGVEEEAAEPELIYAFDTSTRDIICILNQCIGLDTQVKQKPGIS